MGEWRNGPRLDAIAWTPTVVMIALTVWPVGSSLRELLA
jgi:hypothetical protein